MTKKKNAEEPKAEAAPEAAAPETKQEDTITATLPAYQALLIVGVNKKGSIFHHFSGESLNILSMLGLAKYLEAMLNKILNKALPENIQKL